MDLAELLNEYIRSELIVVIPVLYFLGRILRRSKVLCKRIPAVSYTHLGALYPHF